MTAMLTATRMPTAPTVGASDFAKHVARLTGTRPELWLDPAELGEGERAAAVELAAEVLLATNPAAPAADEIDRFEEVTDPAERAEAVAQGVLAEAMAAEMVADLAREAVEARAERSAREATELDYLREEFGAVAPGWSRVECEAVTKWSPFRGGPRHVVRCADGSRRFGNGDRATTQR
ncbi:hypothetical protein ACFW1A_15935 [Kitasatospora sp. NPDC058965]|uniref:hypothetical protein n=1 Tax=Kitasatospora sp. NPDC058965 TaxID=3346682 RepID=UPI003675571F